MYCILYTYVICILFLYILCNICVPSFAKVGGLSCSYRKYRKHHENVEAPSPCLKWDFSNWLWKLHGRMQEAYQGLSAESGCQWLYNCGQRLHTAGSHWDVRICQNMSNIMRYVRYWMLLTTLWQLFDWLWLERSGKHKKKINDISMTVLHGWGPGRDRPLAGAKAGYTDHSLDGTKAAKRCKTLQKCQEHEATWINIAADIAWVGGTLCLRVWKAWKNHRNFAKSFCRAAHIQVVKSTTSLPVSFEIPNIKDHKSHKRDHMCACQIFLRVFPFPFKQKRPVFSPRSRHIERLRTSLVELFTRRSLDLVELEWFDYIGKYNGNIKYII